MYRLYKRVELLPEKMYLGEEESFNNQKIRPADDGKGKKENREKQYLEEQHRKGKLIVEQARAEAEAIVARAKEEEEEIKIRAREAGWQEGIAQGKKQVEEEWQKRIKIWETWLEKIEKREQDVLAKLEEPLLELSFALAEKIIQREAEREPFVKQVIESAIRKLTYKERVLVRVNPGEYQLVREIKDRLMEEIDGLRFLEIQEDPRVEAGGCLLETVFGNIDGRVKTQLEYLREELLRVVREEDV